MRYIIASILLGVTLIFSAYVQIYPKGRPFFQRPYQELKPLQETLETNYAKMQKKTPTEQEFVVHHSTVNFLRKDIQKVKAEIQIRQINLLMVLVTAFYVLIIALLALFQYLRFGRFASVKGFYHSGKIVVDPPKTEYIAEDDLARFLLKGFALQRDAEVWLRSDEFLRCWKCNAPVQTDEIGSVQEILILEESPRGLAKEELKSFGSVWLCKPRDKIRCKKCGKELVRSARA